MPTSPHLRPRRTVLQPIPSSHQSRIVDMQKRSYLTIPLSTGVLGSGITTQGVYITRLPFNDGFHEDNTSNQ